MGTERLITVVCFAMFLHRSFGGRSWYDSRDSDRRGDWQFDRNRDRDRRRRSSRERSEDRFKGSLSEGMAVPQQESSGEE